MQILDAVRAGGGIVRAQTLRERGCSSRALTQLVRSGMLVRPRGGWLAVPDADPHLIAAARDGVVLSCVTQARRLGLWVLEHDRTHVAAASHAGGVRIARSGDGRPLATVHWMKPAVPRHPHHLIDPIENVLLLVAACQPLESALTIWESALRKQIVDPFAFRRLPLPARARHLLELARPSADSGLETLFIVRLRWLRVPITAQLWIAGHHVDVLIGDRLVFQIDGGTHVDEQRGQDIAHDAQLLLMGYSVFRVGYRDVIDHWPRVQDMVSRAVAQGLHLAR